MEHWKIDFAEATTDISIPADNWKFILDGFFWQMFYMFLLYISRVVVAEFWFIAHIFSYILKWLYKKSEVMMLLINLGLAYRLSCLYTSSVITCGDHLIELKEVTLWGLIITFCLVIIYNFSN